MKNNNLLTSFSIGLVLFILGIACLLTTHSKYIGDQVIENLPIIVELHDSIPAKVVTELLDEFKANEAIKSKSVQYISKEQAKSMMLGELENTLLQEADANPFQASILIRMNAAYYTETYLEDLATQLRDRSYIQDVYYQNDFYQQVKDNINKALIFPFILSIILLLFAIIMIFNTVKLNLKSDAKKIKIMDLVGAKPSFIQKPYTKSAIQMGFQAWIFALILLFLFLFIINSSAISIFEFLRIPVALGVILFLLIIGILVPLFTTKRLVSAFVSRNYQ